MHGTEIPRVTALDRLLQAAPAWSACSSNGQGQATIALAVPRAGGTISREYHLVVTANGSYVSVKEAPDAQHLPTSCPDRHINPDGTFCLGLRAGYLVEDDKTAGQWWDKLHVFLNCQETAAETRAWPDYAQLSHGEEAAELQLVAEDLAREFDLLEEYKVAMWDREGVIAFVAERVDLNTMRPRNGRAACVCGRPDKRGRPLLRRQCWKMGLKCLPILERQRQEAIKDFWTARGNAPCCGTMDGCPPLRAK